MLSRPELFASVLESRIHLRPHLTAVARRSPRENTLLIAAEAVGKLLGRWGRLRRKHIEEDMAVRRGSHSLSTFTFAIISPLFVGS